MPGAAIPFSMGLLGVATLAIAQLTLAGPSTTLQLHNQTSNIVGNDQVTLLDGKLVVAADAPRLGNPTASHTLYILFDYCCPHCRRTHDYLLQALETFPDRLNIVCLPMPRDADCNPEILETETRFEDACEIAELAVAVALINQDEFDSYDRWLFHPKRPPTVQASTKKAREQVGGDALQATLDSQRAKQLVKRNVEAFNAANVQYLPVLMAPGMKTVVGRPDSKEALFALIEKDLISQPNASLQP